MITVHFEDHGQDFLEWDIKDGEVVGCRPFQEDVWKGTKVHNESIVSGDYVRVTLSTGEKTFIIYPVEKVEENASV